MTQKEEIIGIILFHYQLQIKIIIYLTNLKEDKIYDNDFIEIKIKPSILEENEAIFCDTMRKYHF